MKVNARMACLLFFIQLSLIAGCKDQALKDQGAAAGDSATTTGTTETAGTTTTTSSAGFTISADSGNTTEAGTQATFTVKLNSQPSNNVVLSVSTGDITESSVSPTSLIFTATNWNANQTVTVTGVDDDIIDGNQVYDVTLGAAVSGDAVYSGQNPPDVVVTNIDNETEGFTVSSSSVTTTEDSGAATFTVRLNSQPLANVSLPIASSDTTEGTVSPTSLTFTTSNWNGLQTVTVTGVDDLVQDRDQSYSIVLDVATSTDTNYNGFDAPDIAGTNTDNDSAGVAISAASGNTTEAGAQATFTVKLNSQPTANVTIGLTSSDITEGTISVSSLVFTTSNWNANQTVTVTGADDFVQDGNQGYSIIIAAATSSDANYSGMNPADVSLTNTDNETSGFTVTPTIGLVTSEGLTQATFTVTLNSQPTADVVIGLTSSDTTEGTVSPTSLTFTSANWNGVQTVTITGVNDIIYDGNIAYSIVTTATSADTTYNAINPTDVSAINNDDDKDITAFNFLAASNGALTVDVTGSISGTAITLYVPKGTVVTALTPSITITGASVSPASGTATSFTTAQVYTVTAAGGTTKAYTVTVNQMQPVVDTGQTTCYNGAGAVIVCPAAGNVLAQDGSYNTTNQQSYTDNGDNTVTESVTGLVWSKCSAGLTGATCATGAAATYTHADALTYCSNNTVGLPGTGWRLPSIIELSGLVKNEGTVLLIDGQFPGTIVSSYYWTSTSYSLYTANAWVVFFSNGYLFNSLNKTFSYYVRCVR